MIWPASTSEIVGVIGYPVRHSLSPRLHNAAFAVLGLDWCYLAFEVPPGLFDKAVAGAAALGLRGLSVTMPHRTRRRRWRLVTHARSGVLGRVHARVRSRGRSAPRAVMVTVCSMIFVRALGFDPAGRRCGVIGAGGAGRATVLALAEAGAAEVIVVNRTPARAWRSVALAPRDRPCRAP